MKFWCALVFSREFRRPKGAKSKHIFEIWCWCVVSCAPLAVVFHRVHWWQASRLLWLVLSFRAVFPAFCPLSIEEINIQRQQHLNKLNQFKKNANKFEENFAQ